MQIIASGLLRAAAPGTDRACLTFPSVVALANGDLLATGRAGSRKDGDDDRLELSRSRDGSVSWIDEPAFPNPPRVAGQWGTLKICYLTELVPGQLLAAAMWIDRSSHPGQPLFNAETEGCLPMAIMLANSRDNGATWSDWRLLDLPAELGPPSLTAPILLLADGRLAMSIETNKHYADTAPWQQRAVFLHSADHGQSWSAPVTVAEDPTGRIFNWDLRSAVAPDGTIASFAWTYDRQDNVYRNIHRRLSRDGGMSWTAPEDIGFADQAAIPAILPGGRTVLAWVDRFGSRSIRARLAAHVDAPFLPETEIVVYDHGGNDSAGTDTGEALAEMDVWSFGLPSATALPDGDVLVVYYAGTPERMDLHWSRLRP